MPLGTTWRGSGEPRKCIFSWSALLLLLLAAAPAWSASITVSSNQSLGFGKFAAGTGGSISISPAGVRSASGGVVLVSGGGAPAQFIVSGDVSSPYSIGLPANGVVTLKNPSGQTMALTVFTSNPSAAGVLSETTGKQTVAVGATLNVGAAQPPGSYSATFNIDVYTN